MYILVLFVSFIVGTPENVNFTPCWWYCRTKPSRRSQDVIVLAGAYHARRYGQSQQPVTALVVSSIMSTSNGVCDKPLKAVSDQLLRGGVRCEVGVIRTDRILDGGHVR